MVRGEGAHIPLLELLLRVHVAQAAAAQVAAGVCVLGLALPLAATQQRPEASLFTLRISI
jgi:hypothetical protein